MMTTSSNPPNIPRPLSPGIHYLGRNICPGRIAALRFAQGRPIMLDRRALLASAAALSMAPCRAALSQPKPAALNTLFDQFMAENLDNSPIFATSLGLDKGARAAQ